MFEKKIIVTPIDEQLGILIHYTKAEGGGGVNFEIDVNIP